MPRELYSTEEVADLLGLHVRTVRGYVRGGQLRSVRIGRRYRITREDLEAFVGSPLTDPPESRGHRHVDVSSVVEIDAVGPDTAHRVSSLLTAVRTHPGNQPLRVETAYDRERARMKIIILGGLSDTKHLLEYMQAVLES